jgi:hypothetical protein
MNTEVSELLIQKEENGSTVSIFNEKISLQKGSGHLFGILETGHPGQNMLLDHAVGQFENNFSKIITKKIKKNKLDEAFEQILQDVNQNLTNYIKEKNILVDFDSFNGIVAILDGEDLYFTYIGKITTLLIHKIGKDNYKVIDILDTISGSTSKPTVFRIFSNVISGHIQNEDSLFFTTSNILDFITTERIKDFITSCKASTAILEIKNLLNKTEKSINFGSILLKLNPEKNESFKKCEEVVAEIEKEKISEKKAENEDVKKENIQEIKKSRNQEIEEDIDEIGGDGEDYIIGEDEEQEKIEIEHIGTNKMAEKISKKMNKTKNKFFSLKRISQVLIFVIIISTILFLQSLKNKSKENLNVQQEQDYIIQVEEIETKLTQIKAKLIIDEKDEARDIIESVKILISQLPAHKATKINELNSEAQSYLDEIRNITTIDNPKIITELANPASNMIKQKDSIYLYNSNNSLYKLDLETNEVRVVASNIEDKGSWQKNAPDVEDGKTLFLYNGSGISQYDFIENELSEIDINLASGAKIDDLFFYGQKLYLVYGQNNEIFKHIKLTKNSFNSGVNWLSDDTDLGNTVSMAIDGNIWILKNDGEIIKLFKGEQVDFQIKTIDPPLKNPTKIYTAIEMDNIYILEPSGKRIVVIDKLGNLLGQFTSEKFDNLYDFVLGTDEDGKETGKIYLLNGMKVFEVDAVITAE